MPVSVVGAGSLSTDSSISGAGSDFGVGHSHEKPLQQTSGLPGTKTQVK